MIQQIEIEGYKVFREKTVIELGQKGVTCIAGRNNTGKTSILSAFKLLKKACLPNRDSNQFGQPEPVNKDALIKDKNIKISLKFLIPNIQKILPQSYEFILKSTPDMDSTDPRLKLGIEIRKVIKKENMILSYEFGPTQANNHTYLRLNKVFFDESVYVDENMWRNAGFSFPWGSSSNSYSLRHSTSGNLLSVSFGETQYAEPFIFLLDFLAKMEEISAVREVPSQLYQAKAPDKITARSTETIQMLAKWREDDLVKFKKVVSFLHSVDNDIGDIRFPFDGLNGERVVKFAKDRDENSPYITLDNSGSGISQLLGLATHLLHYDSSFFLIDEPQAFLHPQAEAALLKLLLQTNHQVLVATHSPIFINAAREGLIILKKELGVTSIVKGDKSGEETDSIVVLAAELGLPVNHLLAGFGVLWLEGPTEVAVLSMLRAKDADLDQVLSGVNVTYLPNTGDLTGSKVQRITRSICQTLEKDIGVQSCFILDKDNRKAEEIEKLQKQFNDRLQFLPEHEIESYFLNEDALLQFIKEICLELALNKDITKPMLESSLADASKSEKSPSKILEKVFQNLLNTKYEKVKYGPRLAEICLQINPTCLDSFRKLIISCSKMLLN